MSSGYVLCPCCGYETVASDDTVPELCGDCEEAGCEADGSDPHCLDQESDLDPYQEHP